MNLELDRKSCVGTEKSLTSRMKAGKKKRLSLKKHKKAKILKCFNAGNIVQVLFSVPYSIKLNFNAF